MGDAEHSRGPLGWAAVAALLAVVGLGLRCAAKPEPNRTSPKAKASDPAPSVRARRASRAAPDDAPDDAPEPEVPAFNAPLPCALFTKDALPLPPLDPLRLMTDRGPAGPPLLVEPTGDGAWTVLLPAAWVRGEGMPGDHATDPVPPERLSLEGPTTETIELSLRDGRCVAGPVRFKAPVRCPLDADVAAALAGGEQDGGYAIRPMLAHALRDGALLIWPREPSGEARLFLQDGVPLPLRWSAEGCARPERRPTAELVGRVIDPLQTEGPRFVEGCETGAMTDPEGRFRLTIAADQPCQVEAYRMDGSLRALSEPLLIEPDEDDVIEVTLVLPEEHMAGLGMAFRALPQGVVAVQVYPDTPAYEAGLRTGELIVEVDGQPTAGMSDNDFIAFATGPAGTVAQLLVEDAEGERTLIEIGRAKVSR